MVEQAVGLNLIGYQDAITEHVKALYPDFEVIEDTLDDDAVFRRDFHGKAEGYFVIRYGPLMPKRRGKSLKGPLHDEYYATCDIIGVTAKGRSARALAQACAVDLLSFRADGVSGMTLQDDGGMFAAFVVASNEARPTRDLASQRLRFNVNNKAVGTTPRQLSTP